MKKAAYSLCSFVAVLGVACGGSSGVDGSKELRNLDADEKQSLCEFLESEYGGAGETMCGGGMSVSIDSAATCAAADFTGYGAGCTVAIAEDCAVSTGGDPCEFLNTSECAKLVQCSLGMPQM